jgi:GDP-D-mannose dehydratase
VNTKCKHCGCETPGPAKEVEPIEIKCAGGFIAMSCDTITDQENYRGAWWLFAPNGKLVDSESGRCPHRYKTRKDAEQDAAVLWGIGACSTLGEAWEKSS